MRDLTRRIERLEHAERERGGDGTAAAVDELRRRLDEIHGRLVNAPGGPPPPVDPDDVRRRLQEWADGGGVALSD